MFASSSWKSSSLENIEFKYQNIKHSSHISGKFTAFPGLWYCYRNTSVQYPSKSYDETQLGSSATKNSVCKECLRESGLGPSVPTETFWWWLAPGLAFITRIMLHTALPLLFHRFFSLSRSPISNEQSGVVANSKHTLEWVHGVHACIRIAMGWVILRKPLLTFLLPALKMQYSLY